MGTGADEEGRSDLQHPYLQSLLAAQVPAGQIIAQAEAIGFPPEAMLPLAQALMGHGQGGSSMAALFLLLGAAKHWQPFVPAAQGLGIKLFEPLLHPCCSELDGLARVQDADAWEDLCGVVLRRLGYPMFPSLRASGEDAAALVLPWLETGLGLVLDELEMSRFASRSQAWGEMRVDALVLRDGAGPVILNHSPGDPWSNSVCGRSTRLHRVGRLRSLEGLENISILVVEACSDLDSLDFSPPVLVLKGCPRVRQVRSNPRSRLLHLEDCPQLRSIGAAKVWNGWEKVTPEHQTVVLSRCSALRKLPSELNVTGHMVLRNIGPILEWPSDFRVGGDLMIKDCPGIEELPALEVQGCLRVEGESGIRRLAPGTIIGSHLDLRACVHLEGLPRGLRVGGALHLPAHLHRQGAIFEDQEPLLGVPEDHYPVLRTLLLGLRFLDLAKPAERTVAWKHAEAALESLKGEILANPRIEVELLWTASEVWRDLSEELWAEEHPWSCDWNESDNDLPLAWFRGLLLST